MRFVKMQAVGNDFVVVDARVIGRLDWPALAPRVCDRRFGIGADGILEIDSAVDADAAMRMFNPDGTPDFCGNGLRCVARFLAGSEQTTAARPGSSGANPATLRIQTLAGIREAVVWQNGLVTVDMAEPAFEPDAIPMRVAAGPVMGFPLPTDGQVLSVDALSTGTAHAVLFCESLPEDSEFFRLSPLVEHHALFPERTSVMWTEPVDSHTLRVRIWERGAGETWGCGTGACAAAVAAISRGIARSPVTVESRGGALQVEWAPGGPMRMTGPALRVFDGVYQPS